MAQQTAVEWLFEKMAQTPMTSWYEVREKALAMEKEQIIKAYHKGLFGHMELKSTTFADKYYNDTYV